MAGPSDADVARVVDALSELVAGSPAEETVCTWQHHHHTGSGRGEDWATDNDVLIRVLTHERVGVHRASSLEHGELERALRAALADARDPAARSSHHVGALPDPPSGDPLAGFDPTLANLSTQQAEAFLARLGVPDARARLEWGSVSRAVVHSAAASRWTRTTSATLRVSNPPHLGGAASRSARRLAGLDLDELRGFLGELASQERDDETPAPGAPVVLGGEAVAQLLGLLAIHAFSIRAYAQGRSVLRDLLHEQIFDRALTIVDDGADPNGLPFPFDLAGRTKRRVELVQAGVARTPAVRTSLAPELGLPATPHLWAADDARPEHLFLEAGTQSLTDLRAAAEGGIWISSFRSLECTNPRRLEIRAIAASVRRIRNGALGPTLPRLVWETSLLSALGRVAGVGRERIRIADPSSAIGSLVAPALLLPETMGLRRQR